MKFENNRTKFERENNNKYYKQRIEFKTKTTINYFVMKKPKYDQ